MNRPYNVLQYEFFHVGGKSLEAVLAECAQRLIEHLPLAQAGDDTGSGIKTVVRMYDVDGRVTRVTQRIRALEQKRDAYYLAPSKGFIAGWYTKWQLQKIYREIANGRTLIVNYCISHLTRSFQGDWNIARETWRYDFRQAKRAEYLDLLQAAKKHRGFWLFIFKPNDLLAVSNEGVVSLI